MWGRPPHYERISEALFDSVRSTPNGGLWIVKSGQPVELVGRVAVRERPDDRREADDQSLSFWQDGIGMLEQTKK